MNKLEVFIEVDEDGKAIAKMESLRGEIESISGVKVKQGSFDNLVSDASRAEKAVHELDEAIDESFRKTKGLQTNPAEYLTRGIETAQRQVLALQRSFTQLEKSPFKKIADEGAQAADQAYRLQQNLLALYKAPASGRPLAEIDRELDAVKVKAESLRQQLFSLQSGQLSGSGFSKSPFENFSARAAAQQTQRDIALARQENLRLQNEVTVSSRLTGQMLSAFVGANVIGVAVQEVKDLATAWVDTLKAQEAAHREIVNASIDYGTSIESNIKAVKELTEANRNALTAAQATRSYNAGLALASEAGRPDESKELIQRATDLAARRNIPQENVPALIEQIRRGSPGALRELTGQDDIDALNRYASAQHKLVEELDETAKAAARLDAINRSGAILQGEAERQTRTFSSQMAALKKDFDDSSWILLKADLGLRVSYRAIQDALNPPDPAPNDEELDRQAREERTRNVFASIGQSFARIDERFKASDLLKEQKKAAEAEKQAAEEARQAAEQQRKAIEDVQKATEGLYGFLNSHRGRNNPYVSIFSEAQQAAETFESTAASLRKTFGAAADEAIAKLGQLTKAKRDALAEDALSQRFDDRLNAQKLQQEIKALNAAQPTMESVRREVKEVGAMAAQAAQQAARAGAFSRGAFIGSDSPFAPKGQETENDVTLRALVAAKDQGKLVLDPATWAAQHFSFTDDEKFNALVRAKDAGRFVGDPARILSRDIATARDSSNITNARDAARLIREIQADAEARGLDPAAAQRLADEQIINRIKGGVSAEDLRGNPDLRELVTSAMGRNADRLLNREDEARKFQADEIKSRKELKQSLDTLNQTIQKSDNRSVRVEVVDKTGRASFGPAFGDGR